MEPESYFENHTPTYKRRYDALRAFFHQGIEASVVCEQYGFKLSAFYALSRDFRRHLKENPDVDFFFKRVPFGRKKRQIKELDDLIIGLRKNNFSTQDIVGLANAKGFDVTYGYVYSLLRKEGFARLPRRGKAEKEKLMLPKIEAPVATKLVMSPEKFHSHSTGLFVFLPLIKKYNIDDAIIQSDYPETKSINRLSSIMSFIALKLSNVKRYSKDDHWCMDRGLGLFAGLNVLPKSAWLSSYSSRVSKQTNLSFLKSLHTIWTRHDLLSDTTNLDFTTIPYWGDDVHLENNWSGKRNKALSSMLTVLAQDPDNGIIDYGNSDVLHQEQSNVVLEYLDFYRKDKQGSQNLKFLVFDSKFTNYENLNKLDDKGIRFITIRRRGKRIVEQLQDRKHLFKTVRVEAAGMKKRTLKALDEEITLRGYGDPKAKDTKVIRQVAIMGHGKIKPALIITNDFELSTQDIIRKYCRRWLVEKGISEQIEFFHLNRLSSSMVIKVDFDLVMTILAHNLYRLFALELGRYAALCDERIYERFIKNNGQINIANHNIDIELKKKRDLPQLLEFLDNQPATKHPGFNDIPLNFMASATS